MTRQLDCPPAGSRILLADDEPRIRDFISRALAASGYVTDAAGDGASVLRQVTAGGYALLILDLIMPGMDGREVLAEVMHRNPDQAVLVLSCLEDVATKVACLELGAQDYLAKPFSLDELLARVLITGSWPARDTRSPCTPATTGAPTTQDGRCRRPRRSSSAT